MRNYGSAHSGLFGPPMMGGQRTMEDLGRGNFGNTPTWGGAATGPSSFGQTFQGTGTPGTVGQMQAPGQAQGMGGYGAPQLGGTGTFGGGNMNLGQMLQQILGQFNIGQLGNMYGLGGPTPAAPGTGAGQPVPIGGPTGQPLADMTGWTRNPTGGGWSRPGPGGTMQGIIA